MKILPLQFFVLTGVFVGTLGAAELASQNPVKISSAPLATVDETEVTAKSVPLPAGTKDANLTLDLGYDISSPTMTFNDALVAFSNIDGLVVIVAPELSDPTLGVKALNLTPGRIPLRDFLTQVCGQVGATWEIDENQAVVLSRISPAETTVISENGEMNKTKIDVDFAGVPLGLALANLAQRTGAAIRVEGEVRDLPIEIIVQGWELERILKYLADMYPVTWALDGENSYVISKRDVADDNGDDEIDTEIDTEE